MKEEIQFFFCGINELPVVYASANRTKPNSAELYRMRSSLQRDICDINAEPHCIVSITKSRSATAAKLLGIKPSKPNSFAIAIRSIENALPARAPQPSGHLLTRFMTSRNRSKSEVNQLP